MTKPASIAKPANGDIIDADVVNAAVQAAGMEEGAKPYDLGGIEDTNGEQPVGQQAYPFGDGFFNKDKELNAINATTSAIDGKKTWLDIVNSFGFNYYQEFTSNGTFNVPSGVKKIYVEAVGGGGGSAGAKGSNVNVNGGGAGRDFTILLDVFSLSVTTIDIVIGAAGTAGTVAPTAGGKGGTTILTCKDSSASTIRTINCKGGIGSNTTTIGIDTVNGKGEDSIFAEGGACAVVQGAGVSGTLGSGGGSPRDDDGGGDAGSTGGAGKVIIYY